MVAVSESARSTSGHTLYIVYGWLFGFWQALIIVTVGLTIAAMAIFALSRYLFRAIIERRYTAFVALMNANIEKEGAFYLLTLRMIHAPFSIVNPVSGASRVSSWIFFWTTVVGLLPANAIWVYVGLSLPSLRELATQGAGAFIDTPLILALVGCGALPIVTRWLLGRFGTHTKGLPDDDGIATDAVAGSVQEVQHEAKHNNQRTKP